MRTLPVTAAIVLYRASLRPRNWRYDLDNGCHSISHVPFCVFLASVDEAATRRREYGEFVRRTRPGAEQPVDDDTDSSS